MYTIQLINTIAKDEGWGIFYCEGSENGDYQIQKIDEDNVFINDIDAIRFVNKMSLLGSSVHKETIKLIHNLNPKELSLI